MRNKSILVLVVVVLAFLPTVANSADLYVFEDTILYGGYDNVYVYDTVPNHTTVTLMAGTIGHFRAYDESTIDIQGGQCVIHLYEKSNAHISGGIVENISPSDSANPGVVNIDGGTVVSAFFRYDSKGNFSGGEIERLNLDGNAVVNISGGQISDLLAAGQPSIVNIYGKNFSYNPTAGAYGAGQLTGNWHNDIPFSIDLGGSDTFDRIIFHTPQHIYCFADMQYDFNGDCKVDFEDFAELASHWLDCNLVPQSLCLE